MQTEPRVPTWVLITALAVAVIVACAESKSPEERRADQRIQVQSSWRHARLVSGHRVHVTKENVACSKCHTLDGEAIGVVLPERCAECHEKESELEHARQAAQARLGGSVRADCTACHAFTLEGTGHDEAVRRFEASRVAGGSAGSFARGIEPFAAADCERCHAEAHGKTPAITVHAEAECVSCHRPHEHERPRSAPCTECHADVPRSHEAAGRGALQGCASCHQRAHAEKGAARGTCLDCHSAHEPIVPKTALFAGGHDECLDCHRAHDFDAKSSLGCRSCHDLAVLGAGKIGEHERCASCHTPHAVMQGPGTACASCHREVHPEHPPHGKQGPCVGCHDPHPARGAAHAASTEAAACSSCHAFVGSDHAAHRGVECTTCHEPHHFGLEAGSKAVCTACHADPVRKTAVNAGHAECNGCHRGLPHAPEATEVGCESCHAAEQARVRAGHTRCTQCHDPHSGTQQQACATCHARQHDTAPLGHRTCTSCHEPHQGSPPRTDCAGCHQAATRSPHGRMDGGCKSCHSAHGPTGVAKPPACASCHAPSTLSGLHTQPQHQPCARCHTGHGEPPQAERQLCSTCHTDRVNHFPNATRCASCHLFTR